MKLPRIRKLVRTRPGSNGDDNSEACNGNESFEEIAYKLRQTGLFDDAFYLDRNADVAASGLDPFDHYVRWGIDEDRQPGYDFDPAWYLSAYGDRFASNEPAMRHFLRSGQAEGLATTPAQAGRGNTQASIEETADQIRRTGLFDKRFYMKEYQDVAASGVDPFEHYIGWGIDENRRPGGAFDPQWYLKVYSDRIALNEPAMRHFLRSGQAEGLETTPNHEDHDRIQVDIDEISSQLKQTGLFDERFYVEKYQDVADSGVEPFEHYIRWGIDENRRPGGSFDPEWYLSVYGNRIAANEPAMRHFLRYGKQEGLITDPELVRAATDEFFDPEYYLKRNPDIAEAAIDPRQHYDEFGFSEGRNLGPSFDVLWYKEEYLLRSDENPFAHYIKNRSERSLQPRPLNRAKDWMRRYFEIDEADKLSLRSGPEWLSVSPRVRMVVIDCAVEELEQFIEVGLNGVGSIELLNVEPSASPPMRTRGSQSIDPETLAYLMSSDDECLWVFCRPDIILAEYAVKMMIFYYSEYSNLLIYSDFESPAEGLAFPFHFLPAPSPLYFSQVDRLNGMFALNGRAAKVVAASILNMSVSFESIWRLAASLPEVRARVINHFLYTWESRNTVVRPMPAVSKIRVTATIIIPTRNKIEILRPCIESILSITEYEGEFRILIVDNESDEASTLDFLDSISKDPRVSVLRFAREFNYAAMNNFAVDHIDSDIIVFLNNDTFVLRADWLSLLCEIAMDGQVGAVGAKLLFPDGTVQHGGCVVGIQGVAAHSHIMAPAHDPGFQGLNQVTREVSAVTGACLAVRADAFKAVGGFDSEYIVAFNDIVLCLRLLEAGLRNIWLHTPLMRHLESQTRGYDNTTIKMRRFDYESNLFNRVAWSRDRPDIYYSESLSLTSCYDLAEPPRAPRPWLIFGKTRPKLKILMLSSTFQKGHGVAVVMAMQVNRLIADGYQVYLGGSFKKNEIDFPGAIRLNIDGPVEAAKVAIRMRFNIVVAHTPPFFSIVRHLGSYPTVIQYDYGEPPPEIFPDAVAREEVNIEKRFSFAMAKHKAAISVAVAEENPNFEMDVLPLGNSHMSGSGHNASMQREEVRYREGWENGFVILNVCRFHRGERFYKGVFEFADVTRRARMMNPDRQIVVLLCGKGDPEDVAELSNQGVTVIANPSNDELLSYYHASDLFISLSRWEGYNLPIGQALAVGLPVLASDIPAHRAFGVETFKHEIMLLERLNLLIRSPLQSRSPRIWHWDNALDIFSSYVSKCHEMDLEVERQRLAGRLR